MLKRFIRHTRNRPDLVATTVMESSIFLFLISLALVGYILSRTPF